MRPRILYLLSRHLAIWLERSLRDDGGDEVPVFLCHPLDILSDSTRFPVDRPVGVLYLYAVAPVRRLPLAPVRPQRSGHRGPEHDFDVRVDGPWIRMRFGFLVLGGSLEEELGLLGFVLQKLVEEPYLRLEQIRDVAAEFGDPVVDHPPGDAGPEVLGTEAEEFLIELVEESLDWTQWGLEEHRRSVGFDVSVQLSSLRSFRVPPVLQRDLNIQFGPADGGSSETDPGVDNT